MSRLIGTFTLPDLLRIFETYETDQNRLYTGVNISGNFKFYRNLELLSDSVLSVMQYIIILIIKIEIFVKG